LCLNGLILPLLQFLSRKSTRSSHIFKIACCHYPVPVIYTHPCSQPWPFNTFVASICQMKSKTSNPPSSSLLMPYSYHFLSQLMVARVSFRRSFTLRRLSFCACGSTRCPATSVSPDLAAKHASTNISPKGLQLGSTGTMLTANVPTAVGYTTHLLNAQSLSRKRSTMHRASRRLLSQYLQSLRKAHPPLAATQSARSNPYHGGQGSLSPN
jgi:hypothetical protein